MPADLYVAKITSGEDISQWVKDVPAGTYRYSLRIWENLSGPVWDEDYADVKVTW